MKTFQSLLPNCGASPIVHPLTRARLCGLVLLAFLCGSAQLRALPILSSNQLVFVNVDHAPMGACSTITYGFKGDICGIGTETGNFPYWEPSGGGGGGMLVALSGSSGLQILPFVLSAASVSSNARYFPDATVQ